MPVQGERLAIQIISHVIVILKMGNKNSSVKVCKGKDADDVCTLEGDDAIANASAYACKKDIDNNDKLTCVLNTCETDYAPNDTSNACVLSCQNWQTEDDGKCVDIPPEYPAGAKPWNIASISTVKPGFKAVAGYIDHGTAAAPGYKVVAGSTIEECFNNASATAKVVGIRTQEHGDPDLKSTCWEYGDGYKDYVTKGDPSTFLSQEANIMVCKNPAKDIMNHECYRPQRSMGSAVPEGFSFNSRF
jgi:hypothetical protein